MLYILCGRQNGTFRDEATLSNEEIKPFPLLHYAWLKVSVSQLVVGRANKTFLGLAMPIHSLTWPDRFFPFVLGQPNAKGKKQSGHVRLAYTAKLEM